jgi:hypothetical protein
MSLSFHATPFSRHTFGATSFSHIFGIHPKFFQPNLQNQKSFTQNLLTLVSVHSSKSNPQKPLVLLPKHKIFPDFCSKPADFN